MPTSRCKPRGKCMHAGRPRTGPADGQSGSGTERGMRRQRARTGKSEMGCMVDRIASAINQQWAGVEALPPFLAHRANSGWSKPRSPSLARPQHAAGRPICSSPAGQGAQRAQGIAAAAAADADACPPPPSGGA